MTTNEKGAPAPMPTSLLWEGSIQELDIPAPPGVRAVRIVQDGERPGTIAFGVELLESRSDNWRYLGSVFVESDGAEGYSLEAWIIAVLLAKLQGRSGSAENAARRWKETAASFAARVEERCGLPVHRIPDGAPDDFYGGAIICNSPHGTLVFKNQYDEDANGIPEYLDCCLLNRSAELPPADPDADGRLP